MASDPGFVQNKNKNFFFHPISTTELKKLKAAPPPRKPLLYVRVCLILPVPMYIYLYISEYVKLCLSISRSGVWSINLEKLISIITCALIFSPGSDKGFSKLLLKFCSRKNILKTRGIQLTLDFNSSFKK